MHITHTVDKYQPIFDIIIIKFVSKPFHHTLHISPPYLVKIIGINAAPYCFRFLD